MLRKAGINFWMLTGDKQITAIQIALSCNFISPGDFKNQKYYFKKKITTISRFLDILYNKMKGEIDIY